jgi:uncharacterized protein YbjT (DUF2867 family)
MKLLIVGATGMIGARLTAEALSRGHSVTAAARDIAKVPAGVPAVALQAADVASVSAAAQGHDVILGAVWPRSTGDAVTEARGATAALIAAALDDRAGRAHRPQPHRRRASRHRGGRFQQHPGGRLRHRGPGRDRDAAAPPGDDVGGDLRS